MTDDAAASGSLDQPLEALRDGASGMAGWRIARVSGAQPTAVAFWLERDDGATIQVLVGQRGEQRCLQETPYGDVSYRQVIGLSDREAADVTRGFADALTHRSFPIARYFPHLAAEAALADDGGRLRLAALMQPATLQLGDRQADFAPARLEDLRSLLVFDAPGIAEFLAPQLAVDGPALLGWVFRGLYLPSVARRQNADFAAYVLEFTHPEREQSARLTLRVGGDQTKAFGRCGSLSLSIAHDGEFDTLPMDVASLASWVIALLRLKSSGALEVRVPASLAEVRATSYPPAADTLDARVDRAPDDGAVAVAAEAGPPPALNLALDPDCGQRCVFCSVKSYVTPTDAGAADVDTVRLQLERAQQLGVREVRLNGIDPLRHSRVLDVVAMIRDMGFPALTVFSTGRPLADAAFRQEFLARTPRQLTVFVPLYGVSEAVHDLVTGTAGSYREVHAAIAGLRAEAPPDAVRVSTVLVKQNVHEIVPLLRWLYRNGLGDRGGAHLPYPMRPTARDPYVEAAVTETALLTTVLADVASLPADEQTWALAVIAHAFRHPCVRWQAEARTRLPVLGVAFPDRPVPLAGTEYRSSQFVHASGTAGEADAFAVTVVECPQAAACALAPVCPREHYSVYAERFGLDEFRAVPPAELYASGAGAAGDASTPRGGGVWKRVRDAWRATTSPRPTEG